MARKDAGVMGLEAVATGLTSFVKVPCDDDSCQLYRVRSNRPYGVQQDRELVHDGFSLSDNHTWHPRLQGSMATEIIVLAVGEYGIVW
ncbi:hypothetical protein MJO28_002439 [Puccinia striiformis f. sp. tritici]|uniref:Uncharacterized protein n=1 Tax=Puccinia striiformis f. sp. tritici TaxID=168172 RepID=A0ACC0ER23_9BASI|nr:hypothetical protein MJO28_002439 [Puccinia striiformis f. sp. tritici]